MAGTKRKPQSITTTSSKKRNKQSARAPTPREEEEEEEDGTWYSIEAIIEEYIQNGENVYVVKWLDIDPATGFPYEPSATTEVTDIVRQLWEDEKRRKGYRVEIRDVATRGRKKKTPRKKSQASKRRRKSHVVESTPAPSTGDPAPVPDTPSSLAPAVETPLAIRSPSPLVAIQSRGSSFDPHGYEAFSQLPLTQSLLHSQSQRSSPVTGTHASDLDSSELFAAGRASSDHATPDSQRSFEPVTQKTEESTQLETSQEEGYTEHSGLLELVGKLAASTARASLAFPPASPAISIAETIADPSAESHATSQIASQSRFKVPESFEAAGSSSQLAQESSTNRPVVGPLADTSGTRSLPEDSHHAPSLETPFQRHSSVAQDLVQSSDLVEVGLETACTGQLYDHPARAVFPTSTTSNLNPSILARADQNITGAPLVSENIQSLETTSEWGTIYRGSRQYAPSRVTPAAVQVAASSQDHKKDASFLPETLYGDASRLRWNVISQTQHTNVLSQHRDYVTCPPPTDQSAELHHQQNAQCVTTESPWITQEDNTQPVPALQTVLPTIEKDDTQSRLGSGPRHDSSQDSLQTLSTPSKQDSFSIQRPPSYSYGIMDSNAPDRPVSPLFTSSGLSAEERAKRIATRFAQEQQEAIAKALRENPYKSSYQFIERGTRNRALALARSQSTRPERTPDAQVPKTPETSASVSANTHTGVNEISAEDDVIQDPQTRLSNFDTADTGPEEAAMAVDNLENSDEENLGANDVDNQTLSDADSEGSGDVLEDDLELEHNEYIVPLGFDAQQRNFHVDLINQKQDILDNFIYDPQGFKPLSVVEDIIKYVKDIETHIDLRFAEAGEQFSVSPMAAVEFGEHNSIKFLFLNKLFSTLRAHSKHVVLVIEEDRDDLFEIIAQFCKAKFFAYSIPTKGRASKPLESEGSFFVTVISSDSSPIIRSPDLIVCLDGAQDAKVIRQKNWAQSSDPAVLVPVLHLVVALSIGHIERYLPKHFAKLKNMETTVKSLAQLHNRHKEPFVGGAVALAVEEAKQVAGWLLCRPDQPMEWPLPPLASLNIEFQSQESEASTPPPAPERNKRPLESVDMDTAKRIRLTPEPQQFIRAMGQNDFDVTHISDSMPGTSDMEYHLRAQLDVVERARTNERLIHATERERFADVESQWDARQTQYEDRERAYGQLLGEQQKSLKQLEDVTRARDILAQRLQEQVEKNRELANQLEQQRNIGLLSTEDKIQEITELRKALAISKEEARRAASNQKSTEDMFEHLKDQRQNADETVKRQASLIEDLTKKNAKLEHQASGEPAKLKALHLEKQSKSQDQMIDRLKLENVQLKRTLAHKEEELTRTRNSGRLGYGTRNQSVTPQPRIRSRAGSPVGGRRSNLRYDN